MACLDPENDRRRDGSNQRQVARAGTGESELVEDGGRRPCRCSESDGRCDARQQRPASSEGPSSRELRDHGRRRQRRGGRHAHGRAQPEGGDHEREARGHAEHDRALQPFEHGEGHGAGGALDEQETAPTGVEPQRHGGGGHRQQERAEVVEHGSRGRESSPKTPAGEQGRAAQHDEDRELDGVGQVVPSNGHEHRGGDDHQKGASAGYPHRAGAGEVVRTGRVGLGLVACGLHAVHGPPPRRR